MIAAKEVKNLINRAASNAEPFLFGVDYEIDRGFFISKPLEQTDVLWRVGNISNFDNKEYNIDNKEKFFTPKPVPYNKYKQKFDIVKDELMRGNSFLANLTVQTPLETNYSLEEIFYRSNSPYALFIKDMFTCFSPETFVKICGNKISSNPMKGTINGAIPQAAETILNNYKESAEHYTIVDFIRSDLSRVATHINVEKLRYIDSLKTSSGELLQVSSLITGELPENHLNHLGETIFNMLPAGSISGAPKKSTVEILHRAEEQKRGYYTGIFGYFDGSNLDSAVLIRYIEQTPCGLMFRSGGGITINSVCEDEYNEVLEKVYLPFA